MRQTGIENQLVDPEKFSVVLSVFRLPLQRMARIYLDTNVLISYFRGEIGRGYRGLFIEAETVLDFLRSNYHVVVVSDFCLEELEKVAYIRKLDLENLFEVRKIEAIFVSAPLDLNCQPFEKAGIHSSDALHVALAIYYKCDAIVTFNIKDFEPARKWIKIIDPREL